MQSLIWDLHPVLWYCALAAKSCSLVVIYSGKIDDCQMIRTANLCVLKRCSAEGRVQWMFNLYFRVHQWREACHSAYTYISVEVTPNSREVISPQLCMYVIERCQVEWCLTESAMMSCLWLSDLFSLTLSFSHGVTHWNNHIDASVMMIWRMQVHAPRWQQSIKLYGNLIISGRKSNTCKTCL